MIKMIQFFTLAKGRISYALTAILTIGLLATSAHASSFVPAHDTLRVTAISGTSSSIPVIVTDLLTHAIDINAELHSTNSTPWMLHSTHIRIGADTTHVGYFEVSFLSSTPGTYSATLRMNDSANSTVKYVTIIATIAGNSDLLALHVYVGGTFLNTTVGHTVCQSVTIYFPSDTSNVTLTGAALSHSSSDWSLSADSVTFPYQLLHGHYAIMHICYSPSAVGDSRDTIVVKYRDAHDSVRVGYAVVVGSAVGNTQSTVQLHAFLNGSFTGTQVDSTVCRPIMFYAAIDSGSVTLTSVSLATASSVWSVDGSRLSLPLTLRHGNLDTIFVCFTPSAVAEYHDSVGFHYTDQHGTSQVVYVPLVGTGVHNTTTTATCFRIGGDTSSAYGAITAGTHLSRTMELSNSSSNTWIITRYATACDSGVWTISGLSLPDTLAPNTSSHFTITFLAPSVTTQERYACLFQFFAHHGSDECEQGLGVRGYSKPDTSSVALAPDTTQSIAFESSKPGSTYKYILVKNNTGHRVKVEGISLSGNSHFTVTLVSPDSTIPFYLNGDGTLYLKLTLTDTSAGTYRDTLLITTEDGITSLGVPIVAVVNGATAGVLPSLSIAHTSITVNPNPSQNGAITVSLGKMRHATVEVLDILGRVIWQARDVSGSWKWNGSTLTGVQANSGVYIVRAIGQTTSGAALIASTRFSIAR